MTYHGAIVFIRQDSSAYIAVRHRLVVPPCYGMLQALPVINDQRPRAIKELKGSNHRCSM